MEVFRDYAYYYNMFYGDKDYCREAQMIHELLQRYSSNDVVKILNIGCGTGRHDRELNKLGYHMMGIDFSQQMIEIALKNYDGVDNLKFELGDAREYSSNMKYDAVLSLFHVMSYQNTNEHIIQSFKTAYNALEKDGLFIFDVWYGPGVLTERPTVRKKVVEDENNLLIRYANPIMHPNDDVVDVCYDVLIVDKKTNVAKEIKEIHNMRYFFYPEVKEYLEIAGFELVECLDCDTLQKPSFQSWTVYFIAKRK